LILLLHFAPHIPYMSSTNKQAMVLVFLHKSKTTFMQAFALVFSSLFHHSTT